MGPSGYGAVGNGVFAFVSDGETTRALALTRVQRYRTYLWSLPHTAPTLDEASPLTLTCLVYGW